MSKSILDAPVNVSDTLPHHDEGVNILPASIELSGMEVSLVNAMSRKTVLKQVLEPLKRQ